MILQNDTFDRAEKFSVFFVLYKEKFNELFLESSGRNLKAIHQEINQLFAKIHPALLREDLKKILYPMGGYSSLNDHKETITIGIEIEYFNIPKSDKELLEYTMGIIQKGWNHPGDGSVQFREPAQEDDSSTQDFSSESYGGESTTPIISNNKDLRDAMLNIAYLQAMNAKTNNTCGLHIHLGVYNIKPQKFLDDDETFSHFRFEREAAYHLEFIKQFILIYLRESDKIKEVERPYNPYSKKIEGYSNNAEEIKNAKNLSDLTAIVNPNGDRHYEINLHALQIHGTI